MYIQLYGYSCPAEDLTSTILLVWTVNEYKGSSTYRMCTELDRRPGWRAINTYVVYVRLLCLPKVRFRPLKRCFGSEYLYHVRLIRTTYVYMDGQALAGGRSVYAPQRHMYEYLVDEHLPTRRDRIKVTYNQWMHYNKGTHIFVSLAYANSYIGFQLIP